jgi:hypothetical protein
MASPVLQQTLVTHQINNTSVKDGELLVAQSYRIQFMKIHQLIFNLLEEMQPYNTPFITKSMRLKMQLHGGNMK